MTKLRLFRLEIKLIKFYNTPKTIRQYKVKARRPFYFGWFELFYTPPRENKVRR